MKVFFIALLITCGFYSKAAFIDTLPSNVGYRKISPAYVTVVPLINVSNNPCVLFDASQALYLLDGIQIDYADLKTVNPNDISSVTVFKDKKSTAAYGSKGINGVVLIQTKCKEQSKDAVL